MKGDGEINGNGLNSFVLRFDVIGIWFELGSKWMFG